MFTISDVFKTIDISSVAIVTECIIGEFMCVIVTFNRLLNFTTSLTHKDNSGSFTNVY